MTVDNAALEAGIETGQPVDGGTFEITSGDGDHTELSGNGTRQFTLLPRGGASDTFTGQIATP